MKEKDLWALEEMLQRYTGPVDRVLEEKGRSVPATTVVDLQDLVKFTIGMAIRSFEAGKLHTLLRRG